MDEITKLKQQLERYQDMFKRQSDAYTNLVGECAELKDRIKFLEGQIDAYQYFLN